MYRKRNYWLAAGLIGLNGTAFGLGLGQIEVNSGLNEPLDAEIRVLSATSQELKGLTAQLATAAAFERVGIDRSQLAQPLTFNVETNLKGESVIRVRTKDLVKDPFLSFLLEVNFASGKLLREYTVLLDPPVFTPASRSAVLVAKALPAAQPEPIAEPTAQVPEIAVAEVEPAAPEPIAEPVAETAPALVAEPVEVATQANIEPPPPAAPSTPEAEAEIMAAAAADAASRPAEEFVPASAPAQDQYGPVAAGTTLYQVARELQPGARNQERLILALYRTNPDAFFEQNVNALKRGAILRVPSSAQIDAISVADAQAALSSDNTRWNEYRQAKALNVPRLADLGATQDVAGSPPKAPPSRLELVPPNSGGDGSADRPGSGQNAASADAARVTAELNRSKEDLTASRQESAEFRSRVTELETINTQREQVIALQNQQLKDLEAQLKKAREDAAKAAIAAAAVQPAAEPIVPIVPTEAGLAGPTPTPPAGGVTAEDVWGTPVGPDAAAEPAAADATLPADVATAGTEAPTDDMSETTASGEPIVSAEPEATPAPEPAAAQPVAQAPVAVQPGAGGLSETLTSTPVLAGLAALVVGLGGLAFWRSRRRKPTLETTRTGPMADDLFPSIGAGGAIGGTIGELDMLDMVRMQPDDLDTRLELIRYYAEQGETDKFEQQAREFYQHLNDVNDVRWQEICEVGQQMLPGNALFIADAAIEDRPASDPFGDFDLAPIAPVAASADEPVQALPDFSFDSPNLDAGATQQIKPVQAEKDDFSFDFGSVEIAETTKPNSDFSFDFELPSSAAAAATPMAETATKPVQPIKQDFDFDFNFDAPPNVEAPVIDKPVIAQPAFNFEPPDPVGDSEMSFDASTDTLDSDEDLYGGDDTVGTKLDLARAYIDMGDPDGARSMLEEVIGEGSEQQRDEAQKLLATI